MIAHVWGTLLPIGEYAYRTNLLSALFSAAGAGCFFLVVHESLRGVDDGSPGRTATRSLGAAAAALHRRVHLHQLAELERDRGLRRRAPSRSRRSCWLAMLRWRAARGTRAGAACPAADRLPRRASRSAITSWPCWRARRWSASSAGDALRSEPAPDPLVRRHEWGQARGRGGRLGAADRHRARQHRAHRGGRRSASLVAGLVAPLRRRGRLRRRRARCSPPWA